MHYHSFISALAVLSASLPVYCLSTDHGSPVTLSPINIKDFEAAAGIQRRVIEDFSDLDPATQARLIYGQPGVGNQLLFADMTLHAADGLNIVLLEKFQGLTKAVDCKGDDGLMSLTFVSEQAFDHALHTWDFINEAKDKKFLLIANHDGCGPDDQRQPYLITNIREDKSTLTTFLTAQVAPWSEIANTFDLDFGKILTRPERRRGMKNRGFFHKIGEGIKGGVEDILDKATFDKDGSVAFSIGVGQPGVRTNIVNAEAKHVKIDCVDCYITGKFQVTGHLSVKGFILQDFILDAAPQDVAAKIGLEATISGSKDIFSIDESKELFAFGIPEAGIAIENIFELGAVLSYEVGVSSTFSGEGVVDFGLTASLPNTAKVTADVSHGDQSSAVGFDGGAIDPFFDIKSLSASVDLVAYSKARILFGIKVVRIGKLDVAVSLQVPKITTTLTAAYETQGVCSTDAGSSKTGVKIDSQIDLEVDLDLDATIGNKASPTKSFKLFGINHPLLAKCFPINIPGLSPVSPPTPIPAAPTSIPAPTATLAPTASLPGANLPPGLPSDIKTAVPLPLPSGTLVPVPVPVSVAGGPRPVGGPHHGIFGIPKDLKSGGG